MPHRLLVVPAAAALVLTGLALPAAASTTANELVYTKLTDNGASVVLRDLVSRRDTVVLATSATTDYDNPELSAAGDRVVAAYDTTTDVKETGGIVVANRDGSGLRMLTEVNTDLTQSFDVEPTFSPDGATVLFTRVHATDLTDPTTQTYTLMTVPVAGGDATEVPGGAGGVAGAYDPTDPTRIVFVAVTAPADAAGTISTLQNGTVTSLGQTGTFPKYSPDGQRIAFTGGAAADKVTVMSSTGTGVTGLGAPPVGGYSGDVGWLPDGQSLEYDLYSSSRGYEVWGVNLDRRHGVVVPATASADASSAYAQGPAPAPVEAVGGLSTFVPVAPTRLLDSRDGTGGKTGTFGPGEAYALQVTGRTLNDGSTVPAVTSAVLNVTVTGNSAPSYVQVYPTPVTPAPATSSLNTTAARQTRPNQVTVAVGSDGQVVVRNSAGTAHLLVDITGYYVSGTSGSLFGAVTPKRLLDTRNGRGPVGPAGVVDLQVTGGAVPADATAVTLNLTGTSATRPTNVVVFPTPSGSGAAPNASTLNLVPGETAPNLVTVKVGDGGRVRLQNANGSVQLIADITGFYGGTGATGVYQAVSPTRFLDTRAGLGAAPILTSAGGGVDVLASSYRGLPAAVDSVVLNLTGTGATRDTNVRAYPSGAAQPEVSNLNLARGDTRANAVLAAPGSNGRVRLVNAVGDTHLVADLSGYFVTPAA